MILKKGLYYPNQIIKKSAWVKDKRIYKKAEKDPIKYWENLAEKLYWRSKWSKAFEHNPPYFKWFLEGKINISENIFEKNILGWKNIKDKVALIWEPEPLSEKPVKIKYKELLSQVNKLANALKRLGVKKGDRVAIYLPMIPEVIISMLACTRIGAVHSVVFSAFSSNSLKARLEDTKAKILITADGYWRRGQVVELKNNADEAIKGTDVEKVIVVKRMGNKIYWDKEKDLWFYEIVSKESDVCESEEMDSEDLLFILYTSGSTGKPKGIMHTCGGYTVQTYWTGKLIFNLKKGDIFWSTSDAGWITGHTYTFYSPLLNGVTTLIFEGAIDWPKPDRWCDIIEKNKVTKFYTAPTAIRMFEKYDKKIFAKHKLSSLKILGSVGEPIDEAAWKWYFENVGKKKCPIVDTWWQTETGGILITSLPGIGPFKPSFAGLPLPGIRVDILNESGKSCEVNEQGNLVILPPFSPGMLRGVYNNDEKYRQTYWSQYGEKIYFTSDGAIKDKNGLIRIVGRVDDVIKVAGHRLTTGELEDAINKLDNISESAVIGIPHEIKGEVPVVFVSCSSSVDEEKIKNMVIEKIKKEIGPIALPQNVYVVDDLPKTRSGKIMRRILRKLILKEELGDLSTLSNPEVVSSIAKKVENRN
jgi:acetyl-CoA synthetase